LVDFGCGKGRVLILAHEAGFREVIGIEFAPELARCVQENLRSYRGRHGDVSVHCADAAEFPIPEGPVVAFLFDPFTGPVLEAVAANIRRSFEDQPRAIYVVYTNPERDSPFGRGPPFALLEPASFGAIYRLQADRS
jgi:predicted RNA methylase